MPPDRRVRQMIGDDPKPLTGTAARWRGDCVIRSPQRQPEQQSVDKSDLPDAFAETHASQAEHRVDDKLARLSEENRAGQGSRTTTLTKCRLPRTRVRPT